MVEYTINLDSVFASLADATRRDILGRVLRRSQSVGELAKTHHHLSLAAVAKHIGVLQEAQLITKKRKGRYQIVSANPRAINVASKALQQYKAIWEARFNTLDKLLEK